jgi:hypothetical protein
MQRCED